MEPKERGEKDCVAPEKFATDKLAKPDGCVLRRTIDHFTDTWFDMQNSDMLDLFEWECKHWHRFDPDEEEYSLEHKQLHEQYARDFEVRLERFVRQQGMEVSEFYELVCEHQASSAPSFALSIESPSSGSK